MAFALRARFELTVTAIRKVVVSVPAIQGYETTLHSKDLLTCGTTSMAGKYTLEEHLSHLHRRAELTGGRPLLAFGLRNNLVNPRAMLHLESRTYAADGEQPESSRRSYFGLGLRGGRLVAEQVLGAAAQPAPIPDPFIAGIPVLWDDLSGDALLDAILSEASDHSHVFRIFRGKHPQATDQSRELWRHLHEVFLQHLTCSREEAAAAMRQAAEDTPEPLQRSDDYLHSVLGLTAEGNLVNVVAHGRLEAVGRIAAGLGCQRAVCVDNSGSVMPTFLPHGLEGESIPLLRAPNFRPKGRALLVVELEDGTFETGSG